MKKFLGIFAILMMIGACGALFSDSEIDEEVAEEESVHEENEKETEQVEKVVAKEESEDENEVDGENGSESNENGSDKVDKGEDDISDVEEEEEQEDGNSEEIEVEEESEEPEEEIASSDMLPIYESVLVESFDGLAEVDYLEDSQIFTLLPLDPMFESELEAVMMGYGHDDFQYMVDSLQELSASGVELVGEGYSIALVNPANIENYIVVVTDGVVIYNALDDL